MIKVDELMQILANDFTATTYGASQNFREALEAALAEPEQEPVAELDFSFSENGLSLTITPRYYGGLANGRHNLYTRPSTPIMGRQIDSYICGIDIEEREDLCSFSFHAGVRWAEREHRIGVKK